MIYYRQRNLSGICAEKYRKSDFFEKGGLSMPAKSPVLVCRYADDPGPHHIHSHLSCELIYVRRGKALFTAGKAATP